MRPSLPILAATLAACAASHAAELTDTERRWLRGIAPVVAFARSEKLPLDIVVQPQTTPGAAPLAMAFVDGRCKLVFSMRGNPQARDTLERIDPALFDATLELMAAHELGHCRRHLGGAWYTVPAGFTAGAPQAGATARAADADSRAERREEGFADLTGLAWTRQHHPALYAALHTWLVTERSTDRVPGSPHDTLAWLQLAADGATLDGPPEPGVAALWRRGLVEPAGD